MIYRFIAEKDEDRGCMGFKPKRMPDFEPAGGLGVAHDIFEHHFPNDTGGMEFELMAMGASYWVRLAERIGYEHSEWHEAFYVVPLQMFEYFESYLNRGPHMDRYTGISRPLDDSGAEHNFSCCMVKGIQELEENGYVKKYPEIIDLLQREGVHWLRKGYRYAHKRFGGLYYQGCISRAFYKLRAKVDLMTRVEEIFPGNELWVSIPSFKNPTQFSCTLKSELVYDY